MRYSNNKQYSFQKLIGCYYFILFYLLGDKIITFSFEKLDDHWITTENILDSSK
jgi:hypothetical protein